MITNEIPKPPKFLVLEEDFIEEGIVVLEAGIVYDIKNNSVEGSNGIYYIVKLIPVSKNLFVEYPKNKFVVTFEGEEVLEKLAEISTSFYRPTLLDNVVFISTKDTSFNEIRQMKGVVKVRYERVGRLLTTKDGN